MSSGSLRSKSCEDYVEGGGRSGVRGGGGGEVLREEEQLVSKFSLRSSVEFGRAFACAYNHVPGADAPAAPRRLPHVKKSIAELNDGIDDAGEVAHFNAAVSERPSCNLFVDLRVH